MTTHTFSARPSYAALAAHFKHQAGFAHRRARMLIHDEYPRRARTWLRIAHTFRILARRWGKLAGTLD